MSTRFRDRAIHAGQPPDPATGAVVPPITCDDVRAGGGRQARGLRVRAQREPDPSRARGRAWRRSRARRTASRSRAAWPRRTPCCGSSSPGDHVIIPTDAYGGTFRLVSKVLAPAGIEWTVADLTDLEALDRDWPDGTPLVWVETPTNPVLTIVDIARCLRGRARARRAVVVDNTFATPYLQQPLALGADIVVHSATKYLGGHSDVVGGFVGHQRPRDRGADRVPAERGRRGAEPVRLLSRAARRQDARGAHGAPLRERARPSPRCSLAHPAVSTVLYPGLPDASGTRHRASARCATSAAWWLPRARRGGGRARARRRARRLFTLAESLGAVESLIEHPARMTHASGGRLTARGRPRARPALGRHRDRRRPRRRPPPGPRRGLQRRQLIAPDRANILVGQTPVVTHVLRDARSWGQARARRRTVPTASDSTRKPSWPEMVCTISTVDDVGISSPSSCCRRTG